MATKLLQDVFERASALSEGEQDRLAARLMAELDDERTWDQQFAATSPVLDRIAASVIADHEAGLTVELDPEEL
ncbi:MAG: hypothetical protein ACKVVT_10555 [Dehalococcoidia bacterium]